MKRRRKNLLSTHVSAYLSLNVQIHKDTGEKGLLTIPLIPITVLILWWWQAKVLLRQAGDKLINLRNHLHSLQQKITVGLTLCNIGMQSILYGVGLTA